MSVSRSKVRVVIHPVKGDGAPMFVKRVEVDGQERKYRKVEIIIDADQHPLVETRITFLPEQVEIVAEAEIVEEQA